MAKALAPADARAAIHLLGLRWRPVLIALMFGVAGALSALALAAVAAWLITRAWQMPPVLHLAVAVTTVRALGISRGLCRYLERLATHDLALGSMVTARERLYRRLAAGNPAYAVSLRRGDLLTRTGEDVDELGNGLIRGVIPIGIGAVTSVAAVAVMAFVSLTAAAVLAVALVVSGLVAPWLAAKGSARSIDDAASATAASAQATSTALWHGPELVVARQRDRVLAAARDADAAAWRAADAGVRREALAAAATPIALGASLIAACLIAIDLLSANTASLAGVASGEGLTPMAIGILVLLPLSAFESTAPLTEAGIQLERSRQSATRLVELLEGADGSGAGYVADAEDLEFHCSPVRITTTGLQCGWQAPALNSPSKSVSSSSIDLDLAPGERLAVVGPSGAGKTTLLLTLAGLLRPVQGTVRATTAGGQCTDIDSAACYFAEDGHLFSTTLRDNLLVANGAATDADIDAALDEVGLRAWVDGLAEGLDTVLQGGAEALSGGQRRRLLLARAILCSAPILLLDEPTEHLDAADAELLMGRILTAESSVFRADQTVIVATHHVPQRYSRRLLRVGE